MNKKEIIEKTVQFAKDFLKNAEGGHEWFHAERVWKMAERIAREESADQFVVAMASILHDVADYKLHGGSDEQGMKFVGNFLDELNIPEKDHILEIIQNLSFRKTFDGKNISTLEGQIVQDADRLDALGAIGIARAFAYGGAHNREIFDPNEEQKEYSDSKDYKNNKSSSINHFHEKLLLLKGKMNTETAKRIAEHRHRFMEEYLREFMAEWNGER